MDVDQLTRLTFLTFNKFKMINSLMMQKIQFLIPNLEELKLIECHKLEESAVDFTLNSFSKLKRMDLTGCQVSDQLKNSKKPKLNILN